MKNSLLQRYLQPIQRFNPLKLQHVDHYQPVGLGLLVLGLVLSILVLTLRPVNERQYQEMLLLSQQADYPLSREMARELLKHESVNRYQYFRVLRAIHTEQHNVNMQEEIRTEQKKSLTDVY